jgi:uncharacterized protein YkwD
MFSRRRAATLLATALVALAAPAGADASAQTAPCAGADLVPDAGNLAQVGQATLCLLNDERAAAGLRPLAFSAALTQPSAAYSTRMVSENFFAHESPDGSTLESRLTAARYIAADGDWFVGENLAWGQGSLATARNIAIAWMNSPGHRHNILEPEFTEVGIGIVPGTPGDPTWGATYTTDFGDVTQAAATIASTTAVARAASAGATPAAGKATTTAKAAKASKRCKAKIVRVRASKAKGKAKKATTKRVTTCGTATGRAAATKRS